MRRLTGFDAFANSPSERAGAAKPVEFYLRSCPALAADDLFGGFISRNILKYSPAPVVWLIDEVPRHA
jgi:hypothetical protein